MFLADNFNKLKLGTYLAQKKRNAFTGEAMQRTVRAATSPTVQDILYFATVLKKNVNYQLRHIRFSQPHVFCISDVCTSHFRIKAIDEDGCLLGCCAV
jgi:hypothetical protein